ncbi:hypothetical protein RDI58_028922 [Solanum bulbocastanum]|uniref:Uncharacterized protein n=1 Tax=Solanum bulbocastanum TaxID=147425 RepID=A0AAN8SPJ9_SOLBU
MISKRAQDPALKQLRNIVLKLKLYYHK